MHTISRTSAILALLILVPVPTVAVLLAMVIIPGSYGQAAFMLLGLFGAIFPALWHRLVDRQPLSLSPARRGGFGVAIVSGLVISAIILAGYLLFFRQWIDNAVIQEAAARNGLNDRTTYLLGVFYWVTLNSLKEEYVYRWFMFTRLRAMMSPSFAIFWAGVFFTIHHVAAMAIQGFTWPVVVLANVGVFVGGVFWSWMYMKYQSVWPVYVSHAIVDVPVFLIGWWIIFGQ